MLVQLLLQRGISAKTLGGEALAGESLVEIEKEKPKVVCVPAVPPQGYTHARYICRRLRSRFGELRLIAAILTEQDPADLTTAPTRHSRGRSRVQPQRSHHANHRAAANNGPGC